MKILLTFHCNYRKIKMSSESSEEVDEKPSVPSSSTNNIVFEAATQTPTSEQCDSPMFSQRGYCLRTSGHSSNALVNIHKMRQNDQVSTHRKFRSVLVCWEKRHVDQLLFMLCYSPFNIRGRCSGMAHNAATLKGRVYVKRL